MNWKEYQEEAAEFFRSIGLRAETDVSLQGVRTTHDVDVLVKSHHAGFDITWIVECKHWNAKVSKLHVLALREIVSDLGADRGILLAENGFQSGALEAASLTNVHVTSLAELSRSAMNDIFSMRLRELYERLSKCNEEYWGIPKDRRIECGLRPEVGVPGYAGDWIIRISEGLITKAFGGTYPFTVDKLLKTVAPQLPSEITSVKDAVNYVEPLVEELEHRIGECKKESSGPKSMH